MNPEESHLEVSGDISRRRMLKRIGAGAAVAWSAPILMSVRAPAFAQYGGSPCDDNAPCDLNTPCNVAIDCQGSGGTCNCWVLSDRSACFCGPLDPCSNHQPCGPGDSCPSGQVCVENCCGKLCYAPCGGSSQGPKGKGAAYGTR